MILATLTRWRIGPDGLLMGGHVGFGRLGAVAVGLTALGAFLPVPSGGRADAAESFGTFVAVAAADGGRVVLADANRVARSRSVAKVVAAATTLTAESESITEGLSIGGVLRIGAVRSTASATRTAGREVQRRSSLVVDGLAVGDTPVGFADGGLVLPGRATPLPGDEPLAAVLQQAGLSVQRVDAVETSEGVIAAGLRVTQVQTFPDRHRSFVTLTFGQARAQVTAETVALPELPTSFEPSTPVATGAASPSTVDLPVEGLTGGSPPVRSGSGASGLPAIGPSSAPKGSEAAVAESPPAALPLATGSVAGRTRVPDPRTSASGLYLILALSGVLAAGGLQLVRIRGEHP